MLTEEFDAVELRQVARIGEDVHVLMRPLGGVCSGLRPDNGLDQRQAAHDLVALEPRILRPRLKDSDDTPPLVLADGGWRSLGAVEAVANREIHQRRIWVGILIKIERLQTIGVFRASGKR